MEIMVLILAAIIILNEIFFCKPKSKTSKSSKSPTSKYAKKGANSKKKPGSKNGEKHDTQAKTALGIEDKEETAHTAVIIDDTQGKQTSVEDGAKTQSSGEAVKNLKDKRKSTEDGGKKKKDKKKDKRKNISPTQDSPPKGGKGKQTKRARQKQSTEGATQNADEAEGEPEPTKPKTPANAPTQKTPGMSGKTDKRLLSNPIVTPVTDEFPTDEKEETTHQKQEPKTAGEKKMERKEAQVIDYKSKKKKRGKERNVSDPIVTPVTDEFPTEEEKVEKKPTAKK